MIQTATTPTVNVVDDDRVARHFAGETLRKVGMETLTYTSASEFLLDQLGPISERIEAHDDLITLVRQANVGWQPSTFLIPLQRPGCLLLDLEMPEMDGLDVQRYLRERRVYIPIIFYTGQGHSPNTFTAGCAGAMAFLEKGCAVEELLATVEAAIELDRRFRQGYAKRASVVKKLAAITPSERQVMEGLLRGKHVKMIASELGKRLNTVRNQRTVLFNKLHVDSEAGLLRMLGKALCEDRKTVQRN